MRLYIADDNPDFANFCAEVARREGWTVTICADGAELVETLRNESGPALLLVDIQMPVMDGIQAIEELSSIPRDLRIRFVTGGPDSSALAARMIADARDMNVGRFLTKPLPMETLKQLLRCEMVELDNRADC